MTDEREPAAEADRRPTAIPEWDDLLEDAGILAKNYREEGWDVVVLEPTSVVARAGDEDRADDAAEEGADPETPRSDGRVGFEVTVSEPEYDLLASLVEGDATFGDAEVYYRPAEGGVRRFTLVVERDQASETAVCVPLTYAIDDARPLLERALAAEDLQIHVLPGAGRTRDDEAADEPDGWVTFAHDDPSLFLEESDVRKWTEESDVQG